MITSLDDILNPKPCRHNSILFGKCKDCGKELNETVEEMLDKMKKEPWDTEGK